MGVPESDILADDEERDRLDTEAEREVEQDAGPGPSERRSFKLLRREDADFRGLHRIHQALNPAMMMPHSHVPKDPTDWRETNFLEGEA